ncbi:unnamed protein product [Hydatigera taeniaeformis]|uniref:Uncharacterized protein n=1 Tax=Hydatigena taeniaeformis TaxID=6205 RepID=A0A3P7EYK1_HYDTA|nr:unnamed protein product [Hydatigera taeniaeformis]
MSPVLLPLLRVTPHQRLTRHQHNSHRLSPVLLPLLRLKPHQRLTRHQHNSHRLSPVLLPLLRVTPVLLFPEARLLLLRLQNQTLQHRVQNLPPQLPVLLVLLVRPLLLLPSLRPVVFQAEQSLELSLVLSYSSS